MLLLLLLLLLMLLLLLLLKMMMQPYEPSQPPCIQQTSKHRPLQPHSRLLPITITITKNTPL